MRLTHSGHAHPGRLDADRLDADCLCALAERNPDARTVHGPGAATVPIHQAGLAPAHRQTHHQLPRDLAPAGTGVIVAEHATPQAV
ncbi:hypothetical protein OG943_30970 [Amycolatopsis sp. NBC_00345]|uniref:hypothetical protein n=1 Tax=Amycolatopsis sp. NBC_00345 TaxID=2975955 RepID=UPI002E262D51